MDVFLAFGTFGLTGDLLAGSTLLFGRVRVGGDVKLQRAYFFFCLFLERITVPIKRFGDAEC